MTFRKKLERIFQNPNSNFLMRAILFVPLFVIYFIDSFKHSYFLLLHPPQASFQKVAIQEQTGTYKDSYHKHKNLKSSMRYFTVAALLMITTAGLSVHLIYTFVFPPSETKTAQAATFNVTNSNVAGAGSLHAAITQANSNPNTDTILIQANGVLTIHPDKTLTITNPVVIRYDTGITNFVLSGENLTGSTNCLNVTGDSSTIKDLKIVNCPGDGVYNTGDNNTYDGIYSGTAGTAALANNNGIHVTGSSSGVTIINSVISSNDNFGILLKGGGHTVYNNYIGYNAAGTGLLKNGAEGIFIIATNSTIGTNNVATGNKIASTSNGIEVVGDSNTIKGNLIYNSANGIYIESGADDVIIYNNYIAANTGAGITTGDSSVIDDLLITSNIIGRDDDDNSAPNSSGIILKKVENSEVNDNVIAYNSVSGLIAANSPDLIVDGNTVFDNVGSNIKMSSGCDNAQITSNTINLGQTGVMVDTADYVTISENTISNATSEPIAHVNDANEGVSVPIISRVEYNGVNTEIDVTASGSGTVELFTSDDYQLNTYLGSMSVSPSGTYTYAGEITNNVTATYTNANGSTSEVGTLDPTAPSSSADPAGGSYNTPRSVTITATDNVDSDPTIYYTTDGSDPDLNSPSGDRTLTVIISEDTTLKFFAVDDATNQEDINTETYTIAEGEEIPDFEIRNVQAINIGADHADITWRTTINANSVVKYWKEGEVEVSTEREIEYSKNHSITLNNLDNGTTYHYYVASTTQANETAQSSSDTFNTFQNTISRPIITFPRDNLFFKINKSGEDIPFKIEHPTLTSGKFYLYIDEIKQTNTINDKDFCKIKDDKNTFAVEVDNNPVLTQDIHTAEAVASQNGNTSARTEINHYRLGSQARNIANFVVVSKEWAEVLSFHPQKDSRQPDVTNTTVNPKPKIASFLPVENRQNFTIQVWSKNVDQSDYIYEGNATLNGINNGIANFSRKFFLPQPPGPIYVYFIGIDQHGREFYRSDPFGFNYYRAHPPEFGEVIIDDNNPTMPTFSWTMVKGYYYEVDVDGTVQCTGRNDDGNLDANCTVPSALSVGEHTATITVYEDEGYPEFEASSSFTITAISTTTPSAPSVPSAPSTPEEENGDSEVPGEDEDVEPGETDEDQTDEVLEPGEVIDGVPGEELETEKVIDLTPEEEIELKKALKESLSLKSNILISLNGISHLGKTVDGITKFCIKRCLYPSVSSDDAIHINGALEIPSSIQKRLTDNNASAQAALTMGNVVKIAKVNKTGEWSISVPLSEMPEGDYETTIQASANGINTEEITIAKIQNQKAPTITRTSILVFANLGIAIIMILVGASIYQRRRRLEFSK